ncbi:MAG: YdjY domain-containing protein [Akkermansiaceae bacterium]
MKLFFYLFLLLGLTALAQFPDVKNVDEHGKYVSHEKIGIGTSAEELELKLMDTLQLRKGADDTLKLGKVTIKTQEKQLLIPVTLNMSEGIVEYALVTELGKTHESVLSTLASPSDIQVAMLLLGAQPNDRVQLSIEWQIDGEKYQLELSDGITQGISQGSESKLRLTRDAWVFLGSRFDAKGFAADREGSIISLIDDRSAIFSHKASALLHDQPCHARPEVLPAKETLLKLIVQL